MLIQCAKVNICCSLLSSGLIICSRGKSREVTSPSKNKILFSNLKNRLAEDGDLYLYEAHSGSTPEIFEKMAQENGLKMVGLYDLFLDYYVAHFKYVNSI